MAQDDLLAAICSTEYIPDASARHQREIDIIYMGGLLSWQFTILASIC